ncbi:hypothetical protein GOBAR_DD13146 [Gossypium barbadense]|nr:hypothetical protein GOBAR_DD13146 [Gossypium barbadense]
MRGKLKNVTCYDEVAEMLKDSRLINLKLDENGESYTVQIPICSDISLVLKYEGKEEESFENVDRQTNSKSNLKREKAKVSDILGGFSRKARPDTVKRPLEIRDERSKKKLRNSPGQERQSGDNENKLEEEVEAHPVACKSSGEPSKMMNYAIKDEQCTQFLVSLDKSGTKTEPSYEKGLQSTHQKNDGSCPDVEVFTLDNMPLCKGDYTPFVPSKCYQSLAGEECGDGIRSSSPSLFREQLMDLLKTPYNREEFQNLWRDVTQRKPVQGVKDLRHGRMKSYSTKTVGKSYLDWYKDLRTTVDEFRPDTRECFIIGTSSHANIFETGKSIGFCVTDQPILKNTAHEGAFKPWTDRSYLKALTDQRNI